MQSLIRALRDTAVNMVTGWWSLPAMNHAFWLQRLRALRGNKLSRRAAFKLLRDHETDGRSSFLGESARSSLRRFFKSWVNLSGIKFISNLLQRLAFQIDCMRVYLQKIRVWKHESSLEYINFCIDFTGENMTFRHVSTLLYRAQIFNVSFFAQFVFHERPEN